jgi:hypothetical protein
LALGEGAATLTAVERGLLREWREFTGGLGTLLDHRPWVALSWRADTALAPVGAARAAMREAPAPRTNIP